MHLLEKALQITHQAHKDQVRKIDATPYVIHPWMVAMKLARHGYADTVLAAAIVHDVLEDTQVTEEALREALGEEVVALVRSLTEDKAKPWEARKELYIETIRTAPNEVKAISVADKIHNLESLLDAHALHGAEVWKFFTRGREAKQWFEHALLSALQETWEHSLVDEYAQLVTRMDELT